MYCETSPNHFNKIRRVLILWAAILPLLAPSLATADLFYDFEDLSGLPDEFATEGSTLIYTSGSYAYEGTKAVRIATNKYGTVPQGALYYIGEDGGGKDGGLGVISFYYRVYKTSKPVALTVSYAQGGDGVTYDTASYTQIASFDVDSASYGFFSHELNLLGGNYFVRLQLSEEYSKSTYRAFIDNLSITDHWSEPYMADASFSAAELDYGLVNASETLDKIITIANAGAPTTETLVIDAAGLSFEGDDADKFSVVGFSGASVAPGKSVNLTIRYAPGNDGLVHAATATLLSNDPVSPALALSGFNHAVALDLSSARSLDEGAYVTVSGTATATVATNGLTPGRNQFYVQDASGDDGQTGLLIDDPDDALAQVFALGDQICDLTGTMTLLNGITALTPAQSATYIGAGNAPEALELSGDEAPAAIESELVAISGVFFEETGNWSAAQTVSIIRPSLTPLAEIFVSENSTLIGEEIPGVTVPKHIAGIANATQIMPRCATDVTGGDEGEALIDPSSNFSLAFGEQGIHSGRTSQTITISNTGTAPLVWDSPAAVLSSSDAAEFSFSSNMNAPDILWQGESMDVTIYMDPETIDSKYARLTLYSNASNKSSLRITLRGNGIESDAGNSWTQYNGGPLHHGSRAVDTPITDLESPAWITGAQGLIANASPCIVEDDDADHPVRVYAWGADNSGSSASQFFIKCFDGDTGELLHTTGGIALTSSYGSFYYGSKHTLAVDPESDNVCFAIDSYIYCYDMTLTTQKWRTVLTGNVIYNGSCAIGDGLVYVADYNFGTSYLQAYYLEDADGESNDAGDLAWSLSDNSAGWDTPVYAEDGDDAFIYHTILAAGSSYGSIQCCDAATGDLVWDYDTPSTRTVCKVSEGNWGGLAYRDGCLFLPSNPSYFEDELHNLGCFDAATGEEIWQVEDCVASSASPTVANGMVYVTGVYAYSSDAPAYVVAYDAATGARVFEHEIGAGLNTRFSCVAATEDALYVTEGEDGGGLHMLDPYTGEERVESPGDEAQRARGSVALGAEGAVYALIETASGNGLAHLACFRPPAAGELKIEDPDDPIDDGLTVQHDVTLIHDASYATEMRYCDEDSDTGYGDWEDYNTTSSLTLTSGTGTKTVWAQYCNGSGETEEVSATIIILGDVPEASELGVEDLDDPTGDNITAHANITLVHDAENAMTMRCYEDGETPGDWMDYAETSPFTLSDGDGLKTVYAEYKNLIGACDPVSAQVWVGAPELTGGQIEVTDRDGDVAAGYTNSPKVAVVIGFCGGVEMLVHEDGTEGVWTDFSQSSTLTLSSGFGVKTVCVSVRNENGATAAFTKQIELISSPYAVEVVDYEGTFSSSSTYGDPEAVLDSPAREFYDPWGAWSGGGTDRIVKLVEPAYNVDLDGNKLITTLNDGATIDVKFDHLVIDDPANPFGVDLLVFGNAFYIAGSTINNSTNMNTTSLSGGIFSEDVTVSVSQDGETWYAYETGPFADGSFPTNAYIWDAGAAAWSDTPSDFTVPVDPDLEDTLAAGGITAADALAAYGESGGGTGYDLAESGYDWIQYVRVCSSGGEIDAFSDVASTTTSGLTVFSFDVEGDNENGEPPVSNDQTVTVGTDATGAVQIMVWEEGTEGQWVDYTGSLELTLSDGEGTKTIYVMFRDEDGDTVGPISRTITLDYPNAARRWEIYQ